MSGRMSVGIRTVALIVLMQSLAGCVNFKSAEAIDQKRLVDIHVGDSRKDVEHILGQPGEYGIAYKNGQVYKIGEYASYSGTASIGGIKMNISSAVAFYQHDQLVEFQRGATSWGKVTAYSIVAKKLRGKLVLGKSNIKTIFQLIGEPQVSSRYFGDPEASRVFAWFVSTNNGSGSYITLGFDKSGVLSAIGISADDDPSMLSLFAQEFAPSLKTVNFKGMYATKHEMEKDAGAAIRALLTTKPQNISSVINLLGKPGTIGISMSLLHPSPLLASSWDIRLGNKETGSSWSKDDSALILHLDLSSLEADHDVQGDIKDISWIPIK